MQKKYIYIYILFLVVFFNSCAKPSLKYNRDQQQESVNSYHQEDKAATFGPNPIQQFPVVLVFGPAKARGFAYAGVIKGFTEEKIPIGAIIGADFGALIGAIYTHSETVHEFEWKVLKIDKDFFFENIFDFSFLTGSWLRDQRLNLKLEEIFQNKKIEEGITPISIGVWGEKEEQMIFHREGEITRLIKKSMTRQKDLSEDKLQQQLINEARALNIGPVVYIDLYSRGDVSELADVVLTPNLVEVSAQDVDLKSLSIYNGKLSVLNQVQEIKTLVGIKGEEEER